MLLTDNSKKRPTIITPCLLASLPVPIWSGPNQLEPNRSTLIRPGFSPISKLGAAPLTTRFLLLSSF